MRQLKIKHQQHQQTQRQTQVHLCMWIKRGDTFTKISKALVDHCLINSRTESNRKLIEIENWATNPNP